MDLRLDNCRISFAQGLFNKSGVVGSEPKYGVHYILSPGHKVMKKNAEGKWAETTIAAAELEVANEAKNGKGKAWLEDLEASKRSIRDGNKEKDKNDEIRDGYEGCKFVAAKSKVRMPVYTQSKVGVKEESESPIYSGCYVNARISLYANTKSGQAGVFASMQGTQFFKDGDSFGGNRAASTDDFEDVAEGADAEDFA